MIERRKPKERRRGEKNGPIRWRYLLDLFWTLCIVAVIGVGSFFIGIQYIIVKPNGVDFNKIWKEYKSASVGGH